MWPPLLGPLGPTLTCADGLALGRYDDDVLVDLDAVFVAEDPRKHDLCPVADGVHLQTDEKVRTSEAAAERRAHPLS